MLRQRDAAGGFRRCRTTSAAGLVHPDRAAEKAQREHSVTPLCARMTAPYPMPRAARRPIRFHFRRRLTLVPHQYSGRYATHASIKIFRGKLPTQPPTDTADGCGIGGRPCGRPIRLFFVEDQYFTGLALRYFFTIRATLNTMASSNSRRSSPVRRLIFSSRYTSVFRWTNSFREVSDTFRLFSKNF